MGGGCWAVGVGVIAHQPHCLTGEDKLIENAPNLSAVVIVELNDDAGGGGGGLTFRTLTSANKHRTKKHRRFRRRMRTKVGLL